MLKPVYDIASHDIASDQWMHCSLIIVLNDSFLQYAVHHDKKVLIWKYYQFEPAGLAQTLEHLTDIFRSDEGLRHAVKESTLVYHSPESCLIPEGLFDIGLHKNYLELLFGTLHKGIVITEKISGWDVYNVFRMPFELDEVCKKTFANAQLRHHTTLWLSSLVTEQKTEDCVKIHFFEKEAVVTVITGGSLQLVQGFKYELPEDVLYHLLNIYRQLHIKPAGRMLYLGGMIKTDSDVYQLLTAYFSPVHTDNLSDFFVLPENFRSVPEHFFSTLLKMSRCV